MKQNRFGNYLKSIRISSGAPNVSEYLTSHSLKISDSYYRALEGGEKHPTIATVDELATALGVDRYVLFQYYLEDVLPPDVGDKLLKRVSAEAPAASAKEALDRRDDTLAVYRQALQNQLPHDIGVDIYSANDEMVGFLEANPELLPLVHYVYMRDSDISRADLDRVRRLNNIKQDLCTIIEALRSHRIADVGESRTGGAVRRFSRTFRLPPTLAGRRFRATWILGETARGLDRGRSERLDPRCTFSHALITCYKRSRLDRIQGRLLDLLAEMTASETRAEDPEAVAFFVSLILSPRPEYLPGDDRGQRAS